VGGTLPVALFFSLDPSEILLCFSVFALHFLCMPKSSFSSASIAAITTCVPTVERWIDDDLDLFGGNEKQLERIKKTIGLNRRLVVEPGVTAADLCECAARDLMLGMNLAAEQVDGLICVTQTPDHSQPCNAALLHGKLGFKEDCAAFDVSLGCSGYVYGLWMAHMMIASGGCENVLLLAGDTVSRLVHGSDRGVAALFGDAGSATLVRRDAHAARSWFALQTDGSGANHLIVPAGGQRRPHTEATAAPYTDTDGCVRSLENLYMDGAEVFNFSIRVEPRAVQTIADYAGVDLSAVDYFVFHQANRYILSSIAKRLKIDPSRIPMETVEKYGNQSSASIPCALCGELGERMREAKHRQLILSGFGVGLSWASALLKFGDLSVCRIIKYPQSD
jgi:3-oxoacyl-[acyl-carrier-protein] synthase-3